VSGNIRYPNITGVSVPDQIAQIRNYLYQLADQLNFALPAGSTAAVGGNQTGTEQPYYELRSLILHELQEVQRAFAQLSAGLATAMDAGDFDGEDGYTPKKGVDYFTEEEIRSVASLAAGKILFTLDEEGNLYYELEE
jgi:hypothetical protein